MENTFVENKKKSIGVLGGFCLISGNQYWLGILISVKHYEKQMFIFT